MISIEDFKKVDIAVGEIFNSRVKVCLLYSEYGIIFI